MTMTSELVNLFYKVIAHNTSTKAFYFYTVAVHSWESGILEENIYSCSKQWISLA